MEISEAIDRAVKARWRDGLINILIDVGLLILEAARSLQECLDEAEPEKAIGGVEQEGR